MSKIKKKEVNKFPNKLYVACREDGGSEWFQAASTMAECLEDDGPEMVATYKLEEVSSLEKRVEVLKTRLMKN